MDKKGVKNFPVALVAAGIVILVILGIIARSFVLAKAEIKISPESVTLQEGKTKKLKLKGVSAKNRMGKLRQRRKAGQISLPGIKVKTICVKFLLLWLWLQMPHRHMKRLLHKQK